MSAATTINHAVKKSISPSRTFFKVSQNIPSIQHAREVIKNLGQYGEMAEYKFMRCPETLKYLNYGFIVYKNREDANKAIGDQFIKIQSELFNTPVEVKIEKASTSNKFRNNRKSENYHKKQYQ